MAISEHCFEIITLLHVMDRLLLVLDYKWPCQLTCACAARNTGKILAEAPGVTEIQLLLIRRRENISICLDGEKEFMSL